MLGNEVVELLHKLGERQVLAVGRLAREHHDDGVRAVERDEAARPVLAVAVNVDRREGARQGGAALRSRFQLLRRLRQHAARQGQNSNTRENGARAHDACSRRVSVVLSGWRLHVRMSSAPAAKSWGRIPILP